ncbi:MAG: glycoside hydrolase family 65 protein [Desulfuromonadaceae bacterium]|nr:glycoside hydrolase family 65 protein [Desulfuromonadaceae bacterium]
MAGQRLDTWSLIYEGFNPDGEGLRETLCTLGNGYFATRGAAFEAEADGIHYPATYLAGGYNRLKTELAGMTVENEDLVNFPNWLLLRFRVGGGEWFDASKAELLDYRQELDMRRGILLRLVRFRDGGGRVSTLKERRLVHQKWPHLGAQSVTLIAENWAGEVEFESALDGRVANAGVQRYRELNNRHLIPVENICPHERIACLKVRTSQSGITLAQGLRTRVFKNGKLDRQPPATIDEPGYAAHRFVLELAAGEEVRIEKVVSLYTSRDWAVAECGEAAVLAVSRAVDFEELADHQERAWRHIWQRFAIDVEGNGPETVMILRLHLFHLLQTVSIHSIDLDVGVPARGWHGEAYRGHIFWDELFIMPLLNLRFPEITRALLRYRFRRMDEARINAREAGFRGAMFPWQSGSSGREESQKVHLNPRSGRWLADNSSLQRHVNLAIACNIWQYYQVTRDVAFMSFCGAEMIFEIARFFCSAAHYNPALDRYEIHGVMGPDEYHDDYPGKQGEGLNNNAYTNLLTVWLLCRALELLEILPEDQRAALCDTIDLQPREIGEWEEISRKMRIVFHDDGIISQFEGYDQLQEFDWAKYRARYGDVMRLDRILEAEGDSPNRYKLSKQADVLMLFYLFSETELKTLFERLGYPFDEGMVKRNTDYYLYRTSHGSTLSQLVHSWVLARSDRERSWKLFIRALESDVRDVQGETTPEGIHLGAMAGTVDLVQRCYLGIETRQDALWFDPRLPDELKRLTLRLLYRGQLLEVECSHERIGIRALRNGLAPSVCIGFGGNVFELGGGKTLEFPLGAAGSFPLPGFTGPGRTLPGEPRP